MEGGEDSMLTGCFLCSSYDSHGQWLFLAPRWWLYRWKWPRRGKHLRWKGTCPNLPVFSAYTSRHLTLFNFTRWNLKVRRRELYSQARGTLPSLHGECWSKHGKFTWFVFSKNTSFQNFEFWFPTVKQCFFLDRMDPSSSSPPSKRPGLMEGMLCLEKSWRYERERSYDFSMPIHF